MVLIAVIKKTSSGRGVQFIDDSGVIYPTSLNFLKNFVLDPSIKIMELPTKYPVPLPEGKFRKAQVYDPTGYYTKLAEKEGKLDSLDKNVIKGAKEDKQYKQIVVDF